MSVDEKRQYINPDHATLSISRQCELIGLPRSSYYREQLCGLESKENMQLMRMIDEEYTRHPFFGSRKTDDGIEILPAATFISQLWNGDFT